MTENPRITALMDTILGMHLDTEKSICVTHIIVADVIDVEVVRIADAILASLCRPTSVHILFVQY